MFVLRYRDAARYGRWRDQMRTDVPPDGIARHLHEPLFNVEDEAISEREGMP